MAAKVTKKQLQPFGGLNAQAKLGEMREEALLTRTRQECFELGFLTVQDLDDEELRYGRCRDKTGRIPRVNGKTELIPRDLYDEMIKEHELRFNQRLRQNLDLCLETMIGIMADDTCEPKDRLEAAKYLMERTIGKTPDKVQVTVTQKPWEEMLTQVTGIAPMTRAQHREINAGIVEAEVEEIEDDAEVDDAEDHQADQDEPAQHNGQAAPAAPPGRPPVPGDDERFTTGGQVVTNNTKESLADVGYHTEGDIPTYGHRKAEAKSYAEQTRDAADLAKRRKEAKDKRRAAVKQRKIARAMGVDAIKDEISGASVDDDGQVTFD